MGEEFGEAVKAILVNLFGEDQHNGPVAKAFQKAELYTIDEFLFFDTDDVKDMNYIDDSGNEAP